MDYLYLGKGQALTLHIVIVDIRPPACLKQEVFFTLYLNGWVLDFFSMKIVTGKKFI